MQTSNPISIPYDTAVRISKLLKEDMRGIDREIRRASGSAGELAINVLKNKRKAMRGCYDQLKSAGVASGDTTVVNDW